MKKVLMAGLLAGIVAGGLVGCTEPIPAMQDPRQPLQISMTGYGIQNDLLVNVLPATRVGAGQAHILIQLYNKTDHDLSVDYKYYFVDDRGAQVDNPSGWQFIRVPPKSPAQFEFTSMSAAAADYHLDIRRAE